MCWGCVSFVVWQMRLEMDWIGLDWIGLDWNGMEWNGMEWIEGLF